MGIGLALILMIYVISFLLPGEKKVDFRENFEGEKKNPYGTYLLKNSLVDLFQADSLVVQKDPLFDLVALQNHKKISYVIINNMFPLNKTDKEELIHFLEKGNHAFVAVRSFGYSFFSSSFLNLGISPYDTEETDSITLRLADPSRSSTTYKFPSQGMHFFVADSDNGYEVLARDEYSQAVLIRYTYGKGSLILSSTPRIFTNYYMVQEDRRPFISQALSYLPYEGELWWDEYYKKENLRFRDMGGGRNNPANSPGLLDYILTKEGLAWAFWLSVLALIIYAIFEAKRKQRIIPVIEKLPNMTLDFTETVGRLYFRSSAHKEIAEKRIRALLGHIRTRYFLKTDKFEDKFFQSLAGKANIPEVDIRILFKAIVRIRNSSEISESQLIEINHYIDLFYKLGAR